ncbi:MAG: apolipoprotein N-acyltransferase, partial [Pseudomonadales bacterium]
MSYLFALVAGALLPLSLAPFNLWPLGLVAVGLWFWTLVRGVGRDWLLGWWFGVGKYAVGASWVYVSIHTYGQASAPLAAGLVALFVAFVAGFAVLNALIFARVRTGNVAADALSFAVVFVLSEWVLTWLLTGFPWLYLGHGHLGTVLSGWAPVGGVFLVSLAAALSAAASV